MGLERGGLAKCLSGNVPTGCSSLAMWVLEPIVYGTCDESCVGGTNERTSRQPGLEMVGLGFGETRHVVLGAGVHVCKYRILTIRCNDHGSLRERWRETSGPLLVRAVQ
jgi:hypothetical protein